MIFFGALNKKVNFLLFSGLFLVCMPFSFAQTNSQASDNQPLDEQVKTIKQQVLELNRDLFILEEELLYPANTQIAVYVSVDIGFLFELDAIKLTIDDQVVASSLYTDKQVDALQRGGIQRLYMGNIKSGDHDMVAVFTGRGPKGRDYRRAVDVRFTKNANAKNIEFSIKDSPSTQQPQFLVKQW